MPKASPDWLVNALDRLNTEDLIAFIENEPAIWDSSKPDYSNNVETDKSWRSVCTKVDPEFDLRQSTEKNQLAKNLHRRWKSLRDCYSRELRKQKSSKSGAAASARKPYIFFEQLRFLEPVQCITESNFDMGEGEPELLHGEDDQEADIQPQYPQSSRSRKRKDSDDQLMDVLKKKMAMRSMDKPTEDPDSMFLLSLVPELKKIPESHKLYVKSQIVNTILGTQSALNIASMPASTAPPPQYHNNMAHTQFYPQHSTPIYENPQTFNYNQASNQMNRNFYQPSSTITHPINPNDSQFPPPIIQTSTNTGSIRSPVISPFSSESGGN